MKSFAKIILPLGVLLCAEAQAQIAPLSATPNWNRAMPNGPDTSVKITEEYAKLVARDAYFGTWPMVNIYNRRLHFSKFTRAERSGPLMSAPLNQITSHRSPLFSGIKRSRLVFPRFFFHPFSRTMKARPNIPKPHSGNESKRIVNLGERFIQKTAPSPVVTAGVRETEFQGSAWGSQSASLTLGTRGKYPRAPAKSFSMHRFPTKLREMSGLQNVPRLLRPLGVSPPRQGDKETGISGISTGGTSRTHEQS